MRCACCANASRKRPDSALRQRAKLTPEDPLQHLVATFAKARTQRAEAELAAKQVQLQALLAAGWAEGQARVCAQDAAHGGTD